MTQQVALITNVCDYAGPPAVQAMLEAGFTVVAHDPSFAAEEALEKYRDAYPGVEAIQVQSPDKLIAYVVEKYGQVQAIVSNDNFPAIHGAIEEMDVTDLRQTLEGIIIFPYLLFQAAIPILKKQRDGRVVIITSCRTELPLPGGSIPDIARAGNNAFLKSLSLELAPYNVPVNGIGPNYLYSEAYFPKEKFIDNPVGKQFIKDVVPARRLGDPDEIGELIVYLATMKGSFQTGSIIKFAGGWPAAPLRPV